MNEGLIQLSTLDKFQQHIRYHSFKSLFRTSFPHCIAYRISALVRRCIERLAPPYLRGLCCSTMHVQRRHCLCSDVQAELIVPHSRTVARASCHSSPNTC